VTTQARPTPDDDHPALAPEHPATPHGDDTSRRRPPAREVVLAATSDEPLDVAAHEAAVDRSGAGAVVTFRGVVRDHDGGRQVTAIEYVGHPSAEKVLVELMAELAARTDCEALAVTHRVGQLAIGDTAIVVAVSAAHRQEAFAAAALVVDEVKHRLPVWKRQQFPDGGDEWVACP
jgi:molybdopterin synthase catalytic subunit